MKIYGDISGFYDTFQTLRAKLPAGDDLSLGDMVDRGPKSNEVLEWFSKNGKAILANHEHMMQDFLRKLQEGSQYDMLYGSHIWLGNGGDKTMMSYGIDHAEFFQSSTVFSKIPKEHIDFINNLPWFHQEPGFIFTHAPIMPRRDLAQVTTFKNAFELDNSILWNRVLPKPREGVIQIYGHNSAPDCLIHCKLHPRGIYLEKFRDMYGSLKDNKDDIFALCLDTAGRGGKLSALVLPEFEIYQEEIK